MHRLSNRIGRLESELAESSPHGGVVVLYEGETEEDAIEKMKESNGGVIPPPSASGWDWIVIRYNRKKP